MSLPSNIIYLDIETGGIHPDSSLLEIGIVKRNPSDYVDLRIKPDDGLYRITSNGMSVNDINLTRHDKFSINNKEAGEVLYAKLKEWSDEGRNRLTCIGLGIHSDVDKICNTVISRGTWNTFVNYDLIEICSLIKMEQLCGRLIDAPLSLAGLVRYFRIPTEFKNFHNALNDALFTEMVMEKLYETFIKR